jgi:GNAT superfamily N-acetyltransferase
MNELVKIINTHFKCCEGFAKTVEIEDNCSYFEAENITDPFFNTLFLPNDFNKDLYDKFSERLITAGRKPSFLLENRKQNIEDTKSLGLKQQEPTVWMKLDFEKIEIIENAYNSELTIEIQTVPYSNEFIETFIKCYGDNSDDIGYEYDSSFSDAYQYARSAIGIDEKVYLLKQKSEIVAIGQVSIDKENQTSFLYSVGTIKEKRRLGYSRYLLNFLLNEVKNMGVKSMFLATEENSPMEKYYDDLGFRIVGSTYNFVAK